MSDAELRKIEELSAEIHKVYCAYYQDRHSKPYWTNGDYSLLDESTKDADRYMARFILNRPTAPKINACKCPNEGARTVRKLDDGIFQCPRCGGITVPKMEALNRDRLTTLALEYYQQDKYETRPSFKTIQFIDAIVQRFSATSLPNAQELYEIISECYKKTIVGDDEAMEVAKVIHKRLQGGK